MNNPKLKLVRIVTVPESFGLIKGQMHYFSNSYKVIGVSSYGDCLNKVKREEGVKVLTVKLTRKITPVTDIFALFSLVVIFFKESPYIVHSHTPKAGLLAMLAARICNVPNRLHTVAGMPLQEASGFKRKLLNAVEKLTYKSSTWVLPNSNGLKKFILEEGFTVKDKIKVIGNGSSNGIDCDFFSPSQVSDLEVAKVRSRYNIKDSDFVFISIGRVVRDKGIVELIQSFKKLSHEKNNVKLIILGYFEEDLDPLPKQIQEEIERNENIFHLGWVDDIRVYLKLSNILVFPSYREGFPNVVLQACAMQIPCIVSNINGCNEIIKNDINGWVVPVKDSDKLFERMNFSLANKYMLDSMGEQARSFVVKTFSRHFLVNELERFYSSL